MLNFIKKNGLIFLILGLSLWLRFYRYPLFPVVGETRDEVAWSMLGASLIQTGQPSAWSHFSAYENNRLKTITPQDETGHKTVLHLVSPALDHPPLFSLIPGFFHQLKYDWDQLPSIKLVRFPLVILGVINVGLLYLVAERYFKNKKWAYLASAIYGFAPSFVFSSRLVVAENLLASWLLLTLYFLQKRNKNRYFYLGLISVAAIMTKTLGVVLPLGLIAIGFSQEEPKLIKTGWMSLLIGELLFILYGAVYDFPLFLEVFRSQAGRKLGLATLQNRLFLHPTLVAKFFFDGWQILGLLASFAFLLVVKSKRGQQLKTYLVLSLVAIAATAGEQTLHGWYDYSWHPLVVICLTWLIKIIYEQNRNWLAWLSWLLLLPTLRLALSCSHNYANLSNLLIRGLMALGALPLVFNWLKKERLAKVSIYGLGVLLLLASFVTVFRIDARTYWELDQYFLSR